VNIEINVLKPKKKEVRVIWTPAAVHLPCAGARRWERTVRAVSPSVCPWRAWSGTRTIIYII